MKQSRRSNLPTNYILIINIFLSTEHKQHTRTHTTDDGRNIISRRAVDAKPSCRVYEWVQCSRCGSASFGP